MSTPLLINSEASCETLIRSLYSPQRKVPIIVITQRIEKTGPVVPGFKFQEVLGPLARVYIVSGGCLKTLNRMLDNIFGIEPSGVRMYMPRMKPNDYPTKHPVWNQWRVDEFPTPEAFMESIRDLCLKRVAYVKSHTHTQRLLSLEEADALLHQASPFVKKPKEPVKTRFPTKGRTVLKLRRTAPKPSPEALQALCERFQRA